MHNPNYSHRWLRPLVDYGPLGAFFIAYYMGDLFIATTSIMATTLVLLVLSYILERSIPLIPLATATIVGIFGGLTLWLNDETFIKTYLNQELCNELNLFSYSFHQREGYNKVTDVSGEDSWQTVRDDLIKTVGLNSIPVVLVTDLHKDGTLILQHEHDGRDLELSEANKVFEHINTLWHGNIRFTTIIEDETWEF